MLCSVPEELHCNALLKQRCSPGDHSCNVVWPHLL